MFNLNVTWENVPINLLSPDADSFLQESLNFNPEHFSLKKVESLTSEAINLLLQIHPIHVIRHRRSMLVIAGYRTFQAASFCFPPNHEIPVAVLDKRTTKQQLALLRYLDLAVTPLLFRLDGSLADSYQLIAGDGTHREQAWLHSSMHSFAAALSVSPSTLCKPKRNSTGKTASAQKELTYNPPQTLVEIT